MADNFEQSLGSISVSVSKGSVYESGGLSMYDAALDDALGREEKSLSNEAIQKGDTLLDTYTVEADAISGGMGSVWRVHHQSWNTDLAMKRPQPRFFAEGSRQRKENFIKECEAWINLGLHPNIVSCYYVREIGGVPTIFSEWMDNGSLKDKIKDNSLYGPTEAEQTERLLDLAIQFARGLRYSHENGLIHRDVKPDNLLLTKEWDAKVADFGLAKARDEALSEEGAVRKGGYTPEYCSGEQATGLEADARTDVYSWALSVLEMYTKGRVWESGPAVSENRDAFLNAVKLPLPAKLRALLYRCLEADADKRPGDFAELEAELHEMYKKEIGGDYPRPAPKSAADTADSLNNRALSFLDMGKPDLAQKLWKQALERETSHPEATYNSNLCAYRYGGFFGDVNDLFMKMYMLNKGTPSARSFYLEGLLKMQAYQSGMTSFKQAAALAADAPTKREYESMLEKAKHSITELPVSHAQYISFDVSEDGKRCAVLLDPECTEDGDHDSAQILLRLYDMDSSRQIAEAYVKNPISPYLRFENGKLYLAEFHEGLTSAFDEHTLAQLNFEKNELVIPEYRREELFDEKRRVSGTELKDSDTGKSLLDTHVYKVAGIDTRGIFLNLRDVYFPHTSKETLDLYDMRLLGREASYALCRIRETRVVILREERLAIAMCAAREAFERGDHAAALPPLDEAYGLMNANPDAEWERLNNSVGAHGRRVALRGWRTGEMRGPAQRFLGLADKDESVLLVDHGKSTEVRIRDTAGETTSFASDAAFSPCVDDLTAYDKNAGMLYCASRSGRLLVYSVENGKLNLLRSVSIGQPVPDSEKEYALLRPFFSFSRPSEENALMPQEMTLNSDGTALLLSARICNYYSKTDDYSNALRVMLINSETLAVIQGTTVALEFLDRDQFEMNQAPFTGACFSPDGRSILIGTQGRSELWVACDLSHCDVYDMVTQRPGRFRADGNSYPDENKHCEIILDWKYEISDASAAAKPGSNLADSLVAVETHPSPKDAPKTDE